MKSTTTFVEMFITSQSQVLLEIILLCKNPQIHIDNLMTPVFISKYRIFHMISSVNYNISQKHRNTLGT